MKLLASGPYALDAGPVGRCSSRGWIRYVELDERGHGIYELTPFGRAWLEERMPSANSSMGEHQEQIGRDSRLVFD